MLDDVETGFFGENDLLVDGDEKLLVDGDENFDFLLEAKDAPKPEFEEKTGTP